MKIAVYGNCQSGPIGRLIESASNQVEVDRLPPVHTLGNKDAASIIKRMREVDIILSQPIGQNWGELGSDNLKAIFSDRPFIEFPVLYFGGFFPHLTYLRFENRLPLRGPLGDYHDKRIIRGFLQGLNKSECSSSLKAKDPIYCHNHYHSAIEENRAREGNMQIKILDFILQASTDKRTFFTFNHPTNEVMWQIAVQFLNLVDLSVSQSARPPVNQYLDGVTAAIPSEFVDLSITNFASDEYAINRTSCSYAQLISDFYQVYSEVNDFPLLSEKNGIK